MALRRLVRLSEVYSAAYERRPVLTAVVTAACLGGAGDLIAQKVIESRRTIDWRRFVSISSASAVYAGGIYVPFLAWAQRFGSGTVKAVLTQMSMDVFVLTPIVYMPMFYYWTEMVRGSSFAAAHEALMSKYWESYVPCLAIWVPAQTLNFWLVPVNFRILFIYATELCWCIVISVISTKGSASVKADTPTPNADADSVQVEELLHDSPPDNHRSA